MGHLRTNQGQKIKTGYVNFDMLDERLGADCCINCNLRSSNVWKFRCFENRPKICKY